jgi:hypothetical protein
VPPASPENLALRLRPQNPDHLASPDRHQSRPVQRQPESLERPAILGRLRFVRNFFSRCSLSWLRNKSSRSHSHRRLTHPRQSRSRSWIHPQRRLHRHLIHHHRLDNQRRRPR